MSIIVGCSRTGCGVTVDIGTEADWCSAGRFTLDPFDGLDYGDRILVALPEGWQVDRAGAADDVIHCPDHAEPGDG